MQITHLQQALKLAEIRRGFCAPNPSVGAVIVKNNQVIATGYHWGSGHPHAEVEALNKIGDAAQDATLYVTLEPCCHTNKKTQPCTEVIIQRGIKQVVYGFRDPNPEVAGQGAQALQQAGITCTHAPLPEINEFYASYQFWWQHQRPSITAKLALSSDAKIAGKHGQRIAITGDEAQQFTHQQRKLADAILTTAKTIKNDDPLLNVRLEREEIQKPIYILDSQLTIPLTAKIFSSAKSITIFYDKNIPSSQLVKLEEKNIRCVAVTSDQHGLSLVEIVNIIGKDGIHDLWIEAGGHCFASFAKESLLQRAFIYIAPQSLGKNAQSAFQENQDVFANAKLQQWFTLGDDVVCELKWD